MIVSIIVPVYNVEKYLSKCIDSILSQTFSDFELILVDDGSTDNCPTICDKYASVDNRIHVIHKENAGVSAARNSGLEFASGKYVTFCDSDDYWANERLEVMVKEIKDSNSDCVITNYCNDNGRDIVPKKKHETGVVESLTKSDVFEYILKYILGHKHGWEVCFRLFKREIINNHNIRFPTTCQNYAEDLGFVLEYSLYCNRISSIEYSGYYYYQRENSMMRNSANIIKLDQMNEVSRWFYPRFVKFFNSQEYKSIFPLIHFILLYFEYMKIIGTPQYSDLPKHIDAIKNKEWYISQTRGMKKCKKFSVRMYGKRITRQIVLFSHFCLHKNWKRFAIESNLAYRFFIK